jgi:hypothetical protein
MARGIFGPALPVTCPICATSFLAGRRLVCPNCDVRLTLRRRHALVLAFVALTIGELIALAVGIPRSFMLIALSLMAPPIQVVVMFVTSRLFSMELEPAGEFRRLFARDSEAATVGTIGAPMPSPAIHFDVSQKRWGVEDVAIAAFLAVVVLGFSYWSLSPVIAKVFPEFGATRTGPDGFPVTAHIGHRVIAFTNRSLTRWTCNATLLKRARPVAAAVFVVDAGKTHGVFYADFLDAHGASDEDLEDAARDAISLTCREPSGRPHFATLAALEQYIR